MVRRVVEARRRWPRPGAAGVPKTAWIRQAIEIALALQAEEDQPISRAEALRALTLLRPVRRVA